MMYNYFQFRSEHESRLLYREFKERRPGGDSEHAKSEAEQKEAEKKGPKEATDAEVENPKQTVEGEAEQADEKIQTSHADVMAKLAENAALFETMAAEASTPEEKERFETAAETSKRRAESADEIHKHVEGMRAKTESADSASRIDLRGKELRKERASAPKMTKEQKKHQAAINRADTIIPKTQDRVDAWKKRAAEGELTKVEEKDYVSDVKTLNEWKEKRAAAVEGLAAATASAESGTTEVAEADVDQEKAAQEMGVAFCEANGLPPEKAGDVAKLLLNPESRAFLTKIATEMNKPGADKDKVVQDAMKTMPAEMQTAVEGILGPKAEAESGERTFAESFAAFIEALGPFLEQIGIILGGKATEIAASESGAEKSVKEYDEFAKSTEPTTVKEATKSLTKQKKNVDKQLKAATERAKDSTDRVIEIDRQIGEKNKEIAELKKEGGKEKEIKELEGAIATLKERKSYEVPVQKKAQEQIAALKKTQGHIDKDLARLKEEKDTTVAFVPNKMLDGRVAALQQNVAENKGSTDTEALDEMVKRKEAAFKVPETPESKQQFREVAGALRIDLPEGMTARQMSQSIVSQLNERNVSKGRDAGNPGPYLNVGRLFVPTGDTEFMGSWGGDKMVIQEFEDLANTDPSKLNQLVESAVEDDHFNPEGMHA